jgi:AcrR family transcriptional regulator
MVKQPHGDDSPKREAILAAALELFAELGFHGTAVPLVAEKAGVGAGTVYRYFDSKEALVNVLYRHWKGEYARQLMTDFPASAPHREQFRELWRRMGAFATRHPRALAFLELHHHAEYLDAESRAVEEALMAPLRGFVAEAQRQQVVKPLAPDVLIAMTYGAFAGLVRASWQGAFALTREVLDAAENCIWEAVRR